MVERHFFSAANELLLCLPVFSDIAVRTEVEDKEDPIEYVMFSCSFCLGRVVISSYRIFSGAQNAVLELHAIVEFETTFVAKLCLVSTSQISGLTELLINFITAFFVADTNPHRHLET